MLQRPVIMKKKKFKRQHDVVETLIGGDFYLKFHSDVYDFISSSGKNSLRI